MTMDNSEMMQKAAKAVAIDDMKKRSNKLRSLVVELFHKKTSVIPAQEDSEQLVSLALEELIRGDGNAFTALVMAASVCRESSPSFQLERVGQDESIPTVVHKVPELMVEALSRAGVFKEGEIPTYYDEADMSLKNKEAIRMGFLFLTNQRLICVGGLQGPLFHDTTAYRILYDDRESQPYLGSLDYIYLNKIRGIRSDYGFLKKQVTIEYHTKYIKDKGRTLFGPLFFKMDLATKTSVVEGPIDVLIQITEPMDTRKVRQEELMRRIEHLIEPQQCLQ
jgi:hypothetical protein